MECKAPDGRYLVTRKVHWIAIFRILVDRGIYPDGTDYRGFCYYMEGKINQTDAAAVEKVFTDMEARVESINVSFVLKARK